MADFVAVLKKTLDGLSDTTPQTREKVYEKARITIAGKLTAMNPPLPEAVVARQKQALEEAIVQVEAEFNRKTADPLSELESVFASLKNPDPRAVLKEPVKPAPPPVERPAVEAPVTERPAVARPAPAAVPHSPPPVSKTAVAAAVPAPQPQPVPLPIERQVPVSELADEPVASAEEQFSYEPDNSNREYIAGDGEKAPRRRGYGRLVAAGLVLALAAGGAYAYWAEREQVEGLLARAKTTGEELWTTMTGAQSTPAEEPTADSDVASSEPEAPTQPIEPTPNPAASDTVDDGSQKFTQRLNADGTEVDAGPAGGVPIIGEGTSVAAATQPSLPQGTPTDVPPASERPASPEQLPGVDGQPAADAPDEGTAPETPDQPADATAGTPPPADATPPAADEQANPSADTAEQTPEPATPPAADGTTSTAETPDATEPSTPVQPGSATEPDATAQAPQPPPADPTQEATQEKSIPVGQRAIFYEERTNVSDASAEPGSIVWALVQESPGNDLPPEAAIRAEATIPGKDVQLRMTIRRNADKTLPASHIVEMIFLTPAGFEGGGIDNVLRMSMKGSEQEAGSPLLGIPAKIADGFFLIALNDSKPDMDSNTSLLQRQLWIDVPVQYKSGRRALFTMEKGIPGAKVFDEALKAWQTATSG